MRRPTGEIGLSQRDITLKVRATSYLQALKGLHGPAQLRLFAALPMLMGDDGWLDMTQAEIARKASMTTSSVSRAMRDLEEMDVVQRQDGRRRFSPQLAER
jgi:DNA-binding MarR family transcriptional regulator